MGYPRPLSIFAAVSNRNSWPGPVALAVALLLGLLLASLPLPIAAIVIVATITFLLALIQPLFALALALLAGPLGALEQLLSGSISLDSGQLLLLLALSAWIGHSLAQRRLHIAHTFLNLPFFLLILVGALSLLGSQSIEVGAKELLKWLEMAVIMLMVLDLGQKGAVSAKGNPRESYIGGPTRTFWIVGMLLLAGISQAVIGIWQFGLRDDGPEHFLVLDRFYRAYGTYEQPNPFGGFMNLSVLLALGVLVGLISAFWYWLRHRTKKERIDNVPNRGLHSLILIAVVALVVTLTGLALLFSWSRGAWMGFAAGAAVFLLFWPRKRIYGLLILALALVLILMALGSGLLPETVAARLTGFADDFTLGDVRGVDINDDNYSVLERQAHWQAGLNMLRDDVWLGSGFGNYAVAYPKYALINWPDALGHAHNYYINLLAEVGVLGLTAYLLFWSAVLWQTIRLLRHQAWPERGISLGLLAIWAALAAHHLVDKLYVNNIYIHLGVLLGLLQLLAWYDSETRVSTIAR
ncbi:MAG: hypothetical protein GWP61_04420 [Chloroflexi bacterium]|jgi:O-antigen ligase|nr:hypothetical protein [Chloroflexota bacterium]